MLKDGFLRFHGQQPSLIGVFGGGSGNVGDNLELGIEDGKEAAAVAVFGPVIGEVGDKEMLVEEANLSWVSSGERRGAEGFALGGELEEVLLIAHGNE